jgi:D-glycero-D-manno-heptose 1,7-bisphosphate phosphatase
MKESAVFLDRDGTINEEMGYINHLSRFVLLPRTAEAIRLLNDAGIKVVVVTNQSGFARGYYASASLVDQVHDQMRNLLAKEGAHLDGIYTCLHGPEEGCPCRKPQPGLILQAARELNIDLSRSYVVGDRYKDIQTGAKAGVKGIFVLTGYGLGEYENFGRTWEAQPGHIAGDLLDAAAWIIEDLKK